MRAGHFNESFAQRPTMSFVELVTHAEYYIKGEERNAKKKVRDVKKLTSSYFNSSK